ncbi:MAG: four helix bundle protein [Planctomycetota bacterium]
MKRRTLDFSTRLIKLTQAIPSSYAGGVISKQLLRAGTSIGANYREALHASTPRHFVTTLEIAQREASESAYWIELIIHAGIMPEQKMQSLLEECRELYAILTSTIVSRKKNISEPS